MFREVLRRVCTTRLKHEVVGETDSGTRAVELILELKPELIVLDLTLPDMDGFNVAERVLAKLPELRILVVSSHCDDYTLFRVEKSGVHGYLDKNSGSIEAMGEAIKALATGRPYFSAAFQEAKVARRNNPSSFLKVLSEWERAILSLIGLGLSDEEIGLRFEISPQTAQKHRSQIMRKLGVKGTPKLIAFAVEHGFTQVPSLRGSKPVYS